MPDTVFSSLQQLLSARAGIELNESRRDVVRARLSPRITELGLDTFDQYLSFLTIGPRRNREFQELLGRIAVTESRFFRHESQFEHFERSLLQPLLDARASTRRLRIWSAACSTGEEPYTLAIILHRALGLHIADWQIEILGTDISEPALASAREGAYPPSSLRTLPPLLRQKYFRKLGRVCRLSEEIRSLVTFERHNLKDRAVGNRHTPWDVIFCRDVLPFFDHSTQHAVLSRLSHQLAADGVLLIGRAESISPENCGLISHPAPHSYCCRRIETPT